MSICDANLTLSCILNLGRNSRKKSLIMTFRLRLASTRASLSVKLTLLFSMTSFAILDTGAAIRLWKKLSILSLTKLRDAEIFLPFRARWTPTQELIPKIRERRRFLALESFNILHFLRVCNFNFSRFSRNSIGAFERSWTITVPSRQKYRNCSKF